MSDVLSNFLKKKAGPVIEYREKIESMMSSGDYQWAEETLLGIYEFINERDMITEKQIQAVDNILNSSYG